MYVRHSNIRSSLYYIIAVFLLVSIAYVALLNKVDFLFFQLLGFLPLEIFLFPERLGISDAEISVHQIHLLGLRQVHKEVPFRKILSVNAMAPFDDTSSSKENDGFLVFPGNGDPPFALYQITYLTKTGEGKRLKLNLYPNEFLMVQEKIQKHRKIL